MDTEASVELFKKHATSILSNICPMTSIRLCSYVLIFKFVPCSGGFDPSNDANLCEIETDNHMIQWNVPIVDRPTDLTIPHL